MRKCETFYVVLAILERENEVSNLLIGKTGTGHYLGKPTRRRKNCCGYTTDDGIHGYLLERLLQLASAPDSSLTTLHEDKFVKVFPVFIAKDAMQIKPSLSFDEKQKQLVGSKIKI